MSNLPPPGPPGPSDPYGDSEPPYGSVPGPDADATQPAWGSYEPGAPFGEPRFDPYGVQPYAPYGANPYATGYPLQQNHPRANQAMTWGIVSLVLAALGFVCCGVLSLAALITGPIGLVMGHRAIKEIDAAPGQWANRGQAQAGFICGILGTALATLLLVGWIAIFGFIVLAGA